MKFCALIKVFETLCYCKSFVNLDYPGCGKDAQFGKSNKQHILIYPIKNILEQMNKKHIVRLNLVKASYKKNELTNGLYQVAFQYSGLLL